MPTIIYPPSIPWNWMFQRPQQLMSQFAARGYTVLYEDPGKFPKPRVQRLSPTFILCQGVSPLELNHPRPRILWLTLPSQINLTAQYEPDLVIFDAVDEPKEEFSSWAPFYPLIPERADLIFASGKSIYEHLSSLHPNVHLIPNGVDYEHFAFSHLPKPTDLPSHGPIIGYSGALAPWLDWELLNFVIRSNPDLQFVFLGARFQMSTFPLNYKNAIYLGLKPYNKIPSYLRHFKVGLIPFRLTEMTKGCNPIKLYEYYAAGLPVLATPLPELLAVPKINLENEPGYFSQRLHQIALDEDTSKTERLCYAQANDWADRAERMNRQIQKALSAKG